jgi:hypothetical protein
MLLESVCLPAHGSNACVGWLIDLEFSFEEFDSVF